MNEQPASPTPAESAIQPPPRWERPAIALERSLIVHGQQGYPGIPGPDGLGPTGWMGPLNGSGSGGSCM